MKIYGCIYLVLALYLRSERSTCAYGQEVEGVPDNEDGLEREGPPIVKTDEGEVEGYPSVHPLKPNFTVNVFLGIPFAQPPLGVFRFGPPVPVVPWNTVYHATRIPPACPQKPYPFGRLIPSVKKWSLVQPYSEDCLFLNVWAPRILLIPIRPVLLDVIVFFHGGGFMKGTSILPIYDGLSVAALQNVVFVSINYRLGSFGYLYLDHPNAPGNMGIMDQVMALKWIQRNIQKFGGDPNKVTVLGHSAGAVSAALLSLSPQSKGLFNRAVLLSGGPTAKWAVAKKQDGLTLSQRLLETVGCDKRNRTLSIECLHRLSVEDILSGEPGFGYDDIFVFKPVVDGTFLTDLPRSLLQKGTFNKVDVLISNVQDEASIFLPGQIPQYFSIRDGQKPYVRKVAFKDGLGIISQLQGLPYQLVQQEYANWEDPEDGLQNAQRLKDMFGDSYFNCAQMELADAYASKDFTVYRILFGHRSRASLWPQWMGVVHGDELLYFFGEPLRPGLGYTPDEAGLSRRFMSQIVQFAKTGNPNVNDILMFQPYTLDNKAVTVIKANETKAQKRYRERQCNLWNNILPQFETLHF